MLRHLSLVIAIFFSNLTYAVDTSPRIASLAPHLTEWVYSLNLGDNLIAVSAYSDYPEKAKSLPRVADVNGINLPRLIALKPDIVLIWQPNSKLGQIEKLKKLGIEVYISNPVTLEDIKREITEVGALTQQVEAAKQYVNQFDKDLAALKVKYSKRPNQRAFFQLWHSPLMTTNDSSLIHQAMSICALDNVFSNIKMPYPTVNKEQVLLINPDIIIISDQKNMVTQKAIWQGIELISAVKNNRIYSINPDYLHRYTNRALIGIEQLCELTKKASD